ncbi:MAG: hypothetical protein HWN66_04960 [Candidatus Helarchaeota archaeon]|nr:hypothetical protein [Candidatus Helarchaeota archaeon]
MSSPPPDSSGGSFLPFVTSVTTDIYERIEKLSLSLNSIKDSLKELITDIQENLKKVSENIEDMIQQGEMNKQMTLEAFADSMNTLVQQIRSIGNENIQAFQSTETQQMIANANNTALMLETRMYDIQISFLINGIHALMNAIKTGKVVGVPVPSAGAASTRSPSQEGLAAPIPALESTTTAKGQKKKHFFGKGARKKTHDEIMEEKKKKEAIFRKYLK